MFKRVCVLLPLLAMVFSMALCSVCAAESYELLPQNAFWQGTSEGNGYVMVEESGEAFLFYSFVPDAKPSAKTVYNAPITVETEGRSLVYNVSVTGGSCVVELLMADKNGETVTLPLGEVLGKGAVMEKGIYKGALPLGELTADKQAVFLGIRVQIMGCELKIKALDVMSDEDVPADVSEVESSAEPAPEESAESTAESEESEEERSLTPEESKDAIFVSRENVSFTEAETTATTLFVTSLSCLGFLVAIAIGISLFRRSRPYS